MVWESLREHDGVDSGYVERGDGGYAGGRLSTTEEVGGDVDEVAG